jgi:Homeodomain-like domain
MVQGGLFPQAPSRKPIQRHPLGKGLTLEIDGGSQGRGHLLRYGEAIKSVKLSDKVARKLLVIEAVELGAKQTHLAEALGVSRQTIHNYRETHKYFGLEGLIHGYNPGDSKSLEKQRKLHANQRAQGNKAEQVAAIREEQRGRERAQQESIQTHLNFSFGEHDRCRELPSEQHPFSQTHGWEKTRYAGVFLYWIPLIGHWSWLHLVMGHFGKAWRIFAVFLLMGGLNIRSMEQLKHVRQLEAGRVLGLGRLPSKTILWEWFYEAARQGLARTLLDDYFRHQLRSGLVSLWLWFTDGHLLPYTGKEKVHYSYNTQRRMPVAGRTSQVTCDATGRIVDFRIEEGKGEMKQWILGVVEQWLPELAARPIAVFDREGYDSDFFSALVSAKQPFVTWDKNVDTTRLEAIAEERFTSDFQFNGKRYSVLEEEKAFCHTPPGGESHRFTLRYLIIWNHASNRRTAGLAYGGPHALSTEEATRAILSRWGASENTFKHIQDRHPWHYHPGFKLVDSDRQEIPNPQIKHKDNLIRRLRKELDKLLRKLVKTPQNNNSDGAPRRNSRRQRLLETIQQQEAMIEQVRAEKKALPEKIDVSTLQDYRSFKQVDNEGKYLFDFVTTAVWNVRKQMVDWLRESYDYENDLVDLFYAITHCHGWIKCTTNEVRVRLEPLQQAKRRAAQEYLCRKLTTLGAQTPMGKQLVVEVGENPLL